MTIPHMTLSTKTKLSLNSKSQPRMKRSRLASKLIRLRTLPLQLTSETLPCDSIEIESHGLTDNYSEMDNSNFDYSLKELKKVRAHVGEFREKIKIS